MEKTTEKELSDFVAGDIVQEYFKNGNDRDIILLQNSEKTYINRISYLLTSAAITKTNKAVQIFNAANLQSNHKPENEYLTIIRDPNSIINLNTKMRDKTYIVNVNGLLKSYRNSHRSGGVYRRPF